MWSALACMAPVIAMLSAIPSAHAREISFETLAQAIKDGRQAYMNKDCEGALKQLNPVIDSEIFAEQPSRTRGYILQIIAHCESQGGNSARALSFATEASRLPDATAFIWTLRIASALRAEAYGEAVSTLEDMQDRDPSLLTSPEVRISAQLVFWLNKQLVKEGAGAELHKRLLALISRDDFLPAKTELGYDGLRLSYARLLAQSGDKAAAQSVLKLIRGASKLQEASLDPDLRSMMPDDFDLRAAAENEIEILRGIENDRPSLLSSTVKIAAAQQLLGDYTSAIATLEAARPYGLLEKRFSDRGTYINWWWEGLANGYSALGRYDDAAAAYRQAIAEGESGLDGNNVSQQINFAMLQYQYGHYQEALDRLNGIEDQMNTLASPYGKLAWRGERARAAYALGKDDIVEADRAVFRQQADVSLRLLSEFYLSTGDDDAAADALIKRLADPDERVSALVELSDYLPRTSAIPNTPYDDAFERVRKRADVQAAIKAAGGTRHFNVPE